MTDCPGKKKEKLQKSGEEYHEDLEAAAELAEKQNALAMTIEAKVNLDINIPRKQFVKSKLIILLSD